MGVPFTIQLDIQYDGTPGTVASSVLVTNVLPPGLNLVSYWIATYVQMGSTYDGTLPYYYVSSGNTGNTVYFEAGNIKNGFHRPIQITVVADHAGTYNNVTTVTGQGAGVYPRPGPLVFPVVVHGPSLFVSGGQSVGEASGGGAAFTVSLSPADTNTITVNYYTKDGTATAGQDYVAGSGTLTFAPGVTNLTVSVPVLDDNLAEAASQSFTLQLTNAVGAEISGGSTPNYVLDDEPPLHISIADAAPVLEGDGSTNLLFPVQFSEAADVPVQLSYSTTGAIVTSGVMTNAAGATHFNLAIQVIGDVAVQSNHTVQVTLSSPWPLGTMDQSVAEGLIIEDDAMPGKMTHMQIGFVGSPQLVGRPFPVTLTALDSYNNPATNFSGPVDLAAYTQVGWQSEVVQWYRVTNFDNGVAIREFTYPAPASNANLVAWYFTGTGPLTASSTSFKVIPSPTLFVSLPAAAAEGDGVLAGAGTISITNLDPQDVVITLTSSDEQEIVVPPSVMIPAGQTSAVFNVTVVDDTRLDGTHSTTISASATSYVSTARSLSVADNESAALTLNLPPSISEGKGSNSVSATLYASSPPALPVLVGLSASPGGQLAVPASVYIPAGQTSATFTVTAIPDNVVDGTNLVTVTAHAGNWLDGAATAAVLDANNTFTLGVLGGNKIPMEGAGTITNGLRITMGGYASNAVTVQLASSKPEKVGVPTSVTIPAGQLFVYTNITFLDDNVCDGTQVVGLTASAPDFVPGTLNLSIPDNDVHHFVFSTIGTTQTSGVPFRVSLSIRDTNDAVMYHFSGAVSLRAVRRGVTLASVPLVFSNILRGSWSGNLTINGWGDRVRVQATAASGMSSVSTPFTVLAPAWATNVRVSRLEQDADGWRLFFNTVTGPVYQVQSCASFPPVWVPVGAAQPGTGNEVSVLDATAAAQSARFYRVSARP